MKLLALCLLLGAAAKSGSISGAVRTSRYRAAVGVLVRLADSDYAARTDFAGRFRLQDVPFGDHKMEVVSSGGTFVVPVHVEGDTMIGVVNLEPTGPVLQSRISSEEWRGIGPHLLYAYTSGNSCDTLQFLIQPVTQRVDSLRTWGRCSVDIGGWPATIAFPYRARRKLDRLSITIVDPDGRLVRRIREGSASGSGSRTWDGRDDEGRFIQSGPYRVRFATAADSLEIPLCLLPANYADDRTFPVE